MQLRRWHQRPLKMNCQKTKVQALDSNHSLGQEVAMVEDFVYLGSLVRSTTQSSPDISCHNSITSKTVLNQDNQIWKSKSTIYMSTKLKYYNTCILPIFLYSSWAVTRDLLKIEDLNQWRLRKLLGIKWYHHVRNNEVRWQLGNHCSRRHYKFFDFFRINQLNFKF